MDENAVQMHVMESACDASYVRPLADEEDVDSVFDRPRTFPSSGLNVVVWCAGPELA